MFFQLLLIAITPGIAILLYVYYRDKYEKEPPQLVRKVFLYGALATFVAGALELSFYSVHLWWLEKHAVFLFALLYSFIVIAPVEEGLKFLVTYNIAYRNSEFNEPMDGIVYATAASLGFATLENIMYVFKYGMRVGIDRAFISVPVHAFMGIIMGSYMGKAKFVRSKNVQNRLLWKAFYIPLLLHGFFDFVLLSRTYLAVLIYPFIIYVMIVSLKDIDVSLSESPFKEKEND